MGKHFDLADYICDVCRYKHIFLGQTGSTSSLNWHVDIKEQGLVRKFSAKQKKCLLINHCYMLI